MEWESEKYIYYLKLTYIYFCAKIKLRLVNAKI